MKMLLTIARHACFQPLWRQLHRLSLVGMNYWSSEFHITGEREAMAFVASRLTDVPVPLLFDVGANIGDYSEAALVAFAGRCRLYAFEPSSATFAQLKVRLKGQDKVLCYRLGFSDRKGEALLHSSEPGSSIASLVNLDRPVRPFDEALDETVSISTIDRFCEEQGIARIDFLKLDIEGHELAALRGAKRMISEGRIHFIQFEFGENNVSALTFLADFVKLLGDYDFHRVVPGRPVSWRYEGGRSEIFATMNYLCELRAGKLQSCVE